MTNLEQTLLFQKFYAKATDDQRVLVKSKCKSAADRLVLVRDTFPTYTIHSEFHSLNIIGLMEKLLGSRIEDLDAMESALLILIAYYHDIGMVFTKEEKDSIVAELELTLFSGLFPSRIWLLNNTRRPERKTEAFRMN